MNIVNFGLNYNIVETNILNLLIVIILLTIYGRSFFRKFFFNRKNLILIEFRKMTQQVLWANKRIAKAKLELKKVKIKSISIRKEASILIQLEKEKFDNESDKKLKILYVRHLDRYKLVYRRTLNQFINTFFDFTLSRVKEKINLHLTMPYQKVLNNIEIEQFLK